MKHYEASSIHLHKHSMISTDDDTSIRHASIVLERKTTTYQLVEGNTAAREYSLLRARRVNLLVSVRKVECRTFKSYLSVCVSVNNAFRCTLHVLSAIKSVPFS
uniref:Uncharacterized protein n=1 Tax=Hyaloperonospora arabidopsidis (strain Emoy2) TaxID=559515 RepID=M4BL03_HYAAE